MQPLRAEFNMQRRVAFADTDMAGIMHFTNFFKYMEETEHAFLRSRGLSVVLNDAKGRLGFPKLSATCDYQRPARYEEVIAISALIRCDDGKSMTYAFSFDSQGDQIATGQLRVAFCRFPTDKPPYALPITDEILQQLFV